MTTETQNEKVINGRSEYEIWLELYRLAQSCISVCDGFDFQEFYKYGAETFDVKLKTGE